VAGYSGDAGNAMMTTEPWYYTANGMMFSTPDSDNDIWYESNCALLGGGAGWWLGGCSGSNNNLDTGGYWTTGVPHSPDVQASRMMVKLI